MKISQLIILVFSLASIFSCGQKSESEITDYDYYDKPQSDSTTEEILIAVTDEEFLQYGSRGIDDWFITKSL